MIVPVGPHIVAEYSETQQQVVDEIGYHQQWPSFFLLQHPASLKFEFGIFIDSHFDLHSIGDETPPKSKAGWFGISP